MLLGHLLLIPYLHQSRSIVQIVVEKVRIKQDDIDRYPEAYEVYHKWLETRNITDEDKEYAKDDLTTFVRFAKRCKKDKNLWKRVSSLAD